MIGSLDRVTPHPTRNANGAMSRHTAAPPEPPTIEVTAPSRAPDLTVNKVIAGAGAAATAAVLGSYLGAAGTVAGAAIGSVASTVATTLYQRSLDRTRDTVVARIRPVVPGQRGAADAETVVLAPVPPPRRPWRRAVAGAVVVFVLGLLAVTGLEWANGSSLTTGQTGTSVGRVVTPGAAAQDPPADVAAEEAPAEDDAVEDAPEGAAEPSPSTEQDPGGTASTDPTATPEPDPTPEDRGLTDVLPSPTQP